ncbi:LolA family protein [Halomarina rubra]|uniref:Outer membrane lipoprotein carrier protein LolA n=1 Tax=Halomarina rubra TaxID=2071873 RepID=A0ABD6ASE5_9EURY|nr:hypothetical protein [Halomarina rubra]
MTPHLRQSPLPALVLVALLVLSGCSAVTDLAGEESPALPSGQEAVEGYRSFDTVRATTLTTVAKGNTTETTENTTVRRARVVQRPSTGDSWSETLAPENRSGDLVVSNESVTWSYDASEDSANRIDASQFDSAEDGYPEYVRRLFDAVGGESAPESVGVSPLPMVPGTPTPPARANGSMGRQTVEYEGTATVDGRRTHVLHLTPRENSGSFAVLNQTVYLDAEHFYPLRQRMAYRLDGNVTTYSVTYRNVTFDPDVDRNRFRFDPPAGTNVTETALPTSTTYDSLDDLRANASTTVPDPSVPEEFSFAQARRTVSTERNYTSVSLTYENDSGMLSVTTHDTTDLYTGTAEGENVTVGSATATYREFGTVRTVGWACAGSYYAVSSDVVSRATLLEVARSVSCDAPSRNATAR